MPSCVPHMKTHRFTINACQRMPWYVNTALLTLRKLTVAECLKKVRDFVFVETNLIRRDRDDALESRTYTFRIMITY